MTRPNRSYSFPRSPDMGVGSDVFGEGLGGEFQSEFFKNVVMGSASANDPR